MISLSVVVKRVPAKSRARGSHPRRTAQSTRAVSLKSQTGGRGATGGQLNRSPNLSADRTEWEPVKLHDQRRVSRDLMHVTTSATSRCSSVLDQRGFFARRARAADAANPGWDRRSFQSRSSMVNQSSSAQKLESVYLRAERRKNETIMQR